MSGIVVQVAMTGSVSWMQPASFAAGVAIAVLAGVVPRAERRPARVGATA